MTDQELRRLHTAHQGNELVRHFINDILRCRRNLRKSNHPSRQETIRAHIVELERGLNQSIAS